MQKKICILLNGYPQSGKDTLAGYMVDKFKSYGISASIFSSVDNVKQAAFYLGWNGTKDEHGRNALSALKDFATKWWDGPFNDICDFIEELQEDEAIIFMVREPTEIDRLIEKYPDIVTIFVDRANHVEANNHADKNVANLNYDWYIGNNSTLVELKESADKLIEHLYGEENE